MNTVSLRWTLIWSDQDSLLEKFSPHTQQLRFSLCIVWMWRLKFCLSLPVLRQIEQLKRPFCSLLCSSLIGKALSLLGMSIIKWSRSLLWYSVCLRNTFRSSYCLPQWKHLKVLSFSCPLRCCANAFLSENICPHTQHWLKISSLLCFPATCCLMFWRLLVVWEQTAHRKRASEYCCWGVWTLPSSLLGSVTIRWSTSLWVAAWPINIFISLNSLWHWKHLKVLSFS